MMRFVGFSLVALNLVAQNINAQGIRREGPDWVRTISGSEPVNARARLHVQSQGRIIVHGVLGDRITWTLTERLRTAREADARRFLNGGEVVARALAGLVFINSQGSSPNASTELVLDVPSQLRNIVLEVVYGGGIEFHGLQGSVRARTPWGEITADSIHGFVWARTGGGKIHLGKINGAVECYTGADSISIDLAGGRVNCQTAGGEIMVKEAGGPVWLSSEGGNIHVEHAAASVEAHAASGLIEVDQAGGIVIADTQGGSIQVGSAQGVKAQSGQGTVRLRRMSGSTNVATAMGSIVAELAEGMPLQDSSLLAAAGDITVMIPSNLRMSVMASNESGGRPHIVSDFSEIRATPFGFSRTPTIVQGAINGGGPMLRVDAGRGMIYLRRLKLK